jgi:hypothetical protein
VRVEAFAGLFLTAFTSLACGDTTDTRPPEPEPEPVQTRLETAPRGGYLALTEDRYGAFGKAPDAPRLGERARAVELPDAAGTHFSLAAQETPVVVYFYRGFW